MSRHPTGEAIPSHGAPEEHAGQNPAWVKAVEATPHGTARDPASFAEYSPSQTRQRVPDEQEVADVHHPSAAAGKARES